MLNEEDPQQRPYRVPPTPRWLLPLMIIMGVSGSAIELVFFALSISPGSKQVNIVALVTGLVGLAFTGLLAWFWRQQLIDRHERNPK